MMFERYTEAARQLIFFARNEAIQSGSPFIETEHLGLALLQEESSLIRRLVPPDLADSLETDLRETLISSSSAQPGKEVPLSHSMKLALAHGADAAQLLNDPYIRSEHLLLGIMKGTDYPAVRILERYGITRERVLREIGVMDSLAIDRPRPKITREVLDALVATLPEGALERAHAALTKLQLWPPLPQHVPPRIAEIQKEMHEGFQRSIRPGMGMAGGSGGSWRTDSHGQVRDGSFSFDRIEDGARVTETHRFFQGHEITIIERLRIKEVEKRLSYSQEIHGPDREHHFDIDFDIR
jgi:Clp amino terminal domain, pathogenicity island component